MVELQGEDRFREYERNICEKVSHLNKVVISCGGGVVLNSKIIENLKQSCYVVLLKAAPEEIFKRVLKNGKEIRPIINKKDLKKEIKKVLKIRGSLYDAAAEIIIDTTGRNVYSIVKEIARKTQLKSQI